MNRRHFLEVAAVSAVALSLPGIALGKTASAEWETLAQPDLLSSLGEPRVRAIGLCYRETHPHESNAVHLAAAICRPPSSPTNLRQQIQNDFAAGRTVIVDGWVLALTEARQCALFSLLHT